MKTAISRRRVLRTVGAGMGAGLAGCAVPVASGDLDERATAQFRVTLSRHGYHDVSVPDSVSRAWHIPRINPGEHTAAKATPIPTPSGDLIVAGDSGLVRRVRPDGEVVWRAATDPSVRGIHGTPTIANRTVYVGAYEGALYAFDLETGLRKWKTKLGDAIGASPAYHDGSVYIAVEYYAPSGSLFAVDARSGEVTWEGDQPTDHPHSSPAIDLEHGRIVVGSNDGVLYAWDYPSMEFAWRFRTSGPIKGPIATYDGAAFFGSWDRGIYRVSLDDGREDWSIQAGDMVMSGAGIDAETETVFVGSHDTHLYALAAETGDPRWSFETGDWIIGCPAVTRDSVLVGSYDGYCYCFEKTSGRLQWRAAGTGRVTSTPLVRDGAVYFTDRAVASRPGGLYKYHDPGD